MRRYVVKVVDHNFCCHDEVYADHDDQCNSVAVHKDDDFLVGICIKFNHSSMEVLSELNCIRLHLQ
jgi:hypothetical protein